MNTEQTWRVGELAETSGLTVRTLHHWDEIGLLSPSRRTAAGHREYSEPDLVRLYHVLALRRLGLGLESIAVCLDVGVDPTRLVSEHLAGVDASVAALGTLRDRLVRVRDELADHRAPDADALLGVLAAIGGTGSAGESVLRRHLDRDQLTALGERAASLGPAAHYWLEVEWPELYRRAEVLRAAGTDPGARQVRRLVRRMDELAALFSGGDRTVSDGVRAAWQDDPAAMAGDASAPADRWRDLAAYLDRARTLAKERS